MISQLVSERPGIGVIYSGTVEHQLGLIQKTGFKNWWFEPYKPIEKEQKTHRYFSDDLMEKVTEFFDDIIEDPSEFIRLYGQQGREIYSAIEFNEYFCKIYGLNGTYNRILFSLCNKDYLCMNGARIIITKYKVQCKFLAVKNVFMWNNATRQECVDHLNKYLGLNEDK